LTLDVETELVARLVTDSVLDGHISTLLPDDFETLLPYGTLRRAPGSRFEDINTRRLEIVRLQIDSYADDGTAAFAAIAELLDAISAIEGEELDTIFVTAVEIPQSPQWSPDPDSARPHYLAHVLVYAHPAA
jgi:hypothetical protein